MHVSSSAAASVSAPVIPLRGGADVAAIADARPPRGHIVGPAGAGKTALVGRLVRLLSERDVTVRVLDEHTDPVGVPSSEVLIVDGLHSLDTEAVDGLLARANDPSAALVLVSRPWPLTPSTVALSRRLGADSPSVVLGPLTQPDVAGHLAGSSRVLTPACVDDILTRTDGLGWLVTRALEAHDDGGCRGPDSHGPLWGSVETQVCYRLDLVEDPRLRRLIELLSLIRDGNPGGLGGEDLTEVIRQGYAEGLLLRNGTMPPVIRSAVRQCLSSHALADLGADWLDEIAAELAVDPHPEGWPGTPEDPRLAAALVTRADGLLDEDPVRAGELYRVAADSGASPVALQIRRARASWGRGDLDATAAFIDSALRDDPAVGPEAADLAAAVWAARGMMATASDVYRGLQATGAEPTVRAAVAHVGVGKAPQDLTAGPALSTLSIALNELGLGLRQSLDEDPPPTTLTHLLRASELFTSSRDPQPVPELPAVIAAAVALGLGDLDTARRLVDEAVEGGQGRAWAARRLLLWKAWLALEAERPAAARQALLAAEESAMPWNPRDEFLRQSIVVSLARRYADLPALEAAWASARPSVRRVDVDLYTILPLSSLLCAAARVGDDTTLGPHFARALDILRQLGDAPAWSTHLHWAGVQRGILLNRPDVLPPHARALVAAAPRNRLAEAMARAGGVWVSVLGGSVDADAVEGAARTLAQAGLAWDGARLASHGARRADDRKVSARLLACARELHPQERAQVEESKAPPPVAPIATPDGRVLSERETEVARLVIEGRTYTEIGELMYISPRTVEHHVAHIKQRLDATSRPDLMSKLRVVIHSAQEGR